MIGFDVSALQGKSVTSAKLQVDTLSGTCLSSYNNQICDLPIEVTVDMINDEWDAKSVTWNTAPTIEHTVTTIISGKTLTGLVPNSIINVSYQGGKTFEVDVIPYFLGLEEKKINYGFMLRAANDGFETRNFERQVFELKDGEPLHIGREVQRDVRLGSKETGQPARLVIEYQ